MIYIIRITTHSVWFVCADYYYVSFLRSFLLLLHRKLIGIEIYYYDLLMMKAHFMRASSYPQQYVIHETLKWNSSICGETIIIMILLHIMCTLHGILSFDSPEHKSKVSFITIFWTTRMQTFRIKMHDGAAAEAKIAPFMILFVLMGQSVYGLCLASVQLHIARSNDAVVGT